MATSARHGHRLPEVIAGYDRSVAPKPVPYPYSPQAWAAASTLRPAHGTGLTCTGSGVARVESVEQQQEEARREGQRHQ
ncbi:hypothetical protein AB0L17_39050, partial [Streptomyces cellulosae]